MQAHSKEHFKGQIAEIIILDKAITTEERIKIQLSSNKWDLTTNTDSDGDGLDAVEIEMDQTQQIIVVCQ